jgi:cobalt-zinc-cadmium efflux system outer membrane protein
MKPLRFRSLGFLHALRFTASRPAALLLRAQLAVVVLFAASAALAQVPPTPPSAARPSGAQPSGQLPAAPLPAGTQAFTLQHVVDRGRLDNPTLLAARAHVTATRASEITAGLRQNPTFTLSGYEVNLGADNADGPYDYSANITRLFERGQKRRWRLDIARATTDVTESQYKDTERQTILQVKQAFTNMLVAKAALKIADDNLTGYRRTVDLSRARLNAGDISQTDFERIDLQQAEFESDYDNAQMNLTQTSDQLQVLLGVQKPDTTFDIAGSLAPPDVLLTLPGIEQQALASRPDYLAAVQSVRVAEANIRMAYANGTTDPTIGGEYDRVGVSNSASFQVAIPLRIFDRSQGEKQRTKFEAQSSRFSETASRNQVVSDVEQAWAAYQSAIDLAKRYNNHYVAEADRVRSNMEYSYRHGGATLLDYLDTLRDYRQTNLDALNANQQVWLSIHQLSFAAATEILP